jgi:hypothetical protein
MISPGRQLKTDLLNTRQFNAGYSMNKDIIQLKRSKGNLQGQQDFGQGKGRIALALLLYPHINPFSMYRNNPHRPMKKGQGLPLGHNLFTAQIGRLGLQPQTLQPPFAKQPPLHILNREHPAG